MNKNATIPSAYNASTRMKVNRTLALVALWDPPTVNENICPNDATNIWEPM